MYYHHHHHRSTTTIIIVIIIIIVIHLWFHTRPTLIIAQYNTIYYHYRLPDSQIFEHYQLERLYECTVILLRAKCNLRQFVLQRVNKRDGWYLLGAE